MPDVLVLVLSGVGPVDQVSINYSGAVSEEAAKEDMKRLAEETAWLIGSEKVRRDTDRSGNAPVTTSASFNTVVTVNRKEGTLPLAPFVTVLKRFPSIEVNYLLSQEFDFRGLEDFENEFVKIRFERQGSSFLYRVAVKDSSFKRLVLPQTQPTAPVEEVGNGSSAWQIVVAVALAVLFGFAAYFGANAISHKRRRKGLSD